MNVPVQHCDGAKAFDETQGASTVLGAPSPLRVDGPQRDVREDHDRSRGGQAPDVIFEPDELFVSEVAETTGLQVHHVDEADKMNLVLVEAVPARASRGFAIAGEVGLAQTFVDHV